MSSVVTPELSTALTPGVERLARTTSDWHSQYLRLCDFAELCKPRIAVMGLSTVAVGFFVGSRGVWNVSTLLHTLFGVGLVAVSCSALNQWFERNTDRLMDRTSRRPLPAGRLSSHEALYFGGLAAVVGLYWLAVRVNITTSLLSLFTLISYVGMYTPLKRYSGLSTVVGAVPGALPPVLGWTAAGGSLDAAAWSLFALLFLWQFPHFLAIAWLLRHQYDNAGLKMMPRFSGRGVGWLSAGYGAVLIPASLLPRLHGLAGDFYALSAVVLGVAYLWSALEFARQGTDQAARGVLRASFLYLPTILAILTLDHWRLLS